MGQEWIGRISRIANECCIYSMAHWMDNPDRVCTIIDPGRIHTSKGRTFRPQPLWIHISGINCMEYHLNILDILCYRYRLHICPGPQHSVYDSFFHVVSQSQNTPESQRSLYCSGCTLGCF